VVGFNPPLPRNPESPPKSFENQPDFKNFKNSEFRMSTPQDFGKKCSKILNLPPARNWFTLAMTNRLAGIINSLKIPKIKKI
jgi:hypothetical protein